MRKIRKVLIAGILLCNLLFVTVNAYVQAGERQAEVIDKDREIGNEKMPREETEEPEEEEPKEDFKPEIQYPKPTGNNGYYLEKPEVCLSLVSPAKTAMYRFVSANGETKEGELSFDADVKITPEEFLDGENSLEVWLLVEEDEEDRYEKKVFMVDTTPPDSPELSYGNHGGESTIFSNTAVHVLVSSQDNYAGISGYHYQRSDGEEGFVKGEEAVLTFEPNFSGTCSVIAEDVAGNRSSARNSVQIVSENMAPYISMHAPFGFDGWYHDEVSLQINIDDIDISAGLATVRVWISGQIAYEQNFNSSALLHHFLEHVIVKDYSLQGQAVEIVVEAIDFAGNVGTSSQGLKIDVADPQIQFLDDFSGMIIGQDKIVKIQLTDDNGLDNYHLELRHEPVGNGEKREIMEEKNLKGLLSHEVQVPVTEEGRYDLDITVRDISGRESKSILHFILDKSSPVIRFVEQLNGSYLPYFQWNYHHSEMIDDFSDYEYQKRLSGKPYHLGEYVDEEGIHVFQVDVVDAAGNQNTARAFFTIDHTAPEIQLYGVEQGGIYESGVTLGVAVEGEGERIRRLDINGESQKLERSAKIFQNVLEEAGEYLVFIRADDLAGNESQKEVRFLIQEEKSVASNKKTWFQNKTQQGLQENVKKEAAMKQVTKQSYWWYVIWGLLFVVGIVLLLKMVKRKKTP
ncbi:MAG: hypothetical protein FWE25_06590 [Lachnospiraceae bacterium]|nr:hypothetical protein [Lachnospiraceae bacterium]